MSRGLCLLSILTILALAAAASPARAEYPRNGAILTGPDQDVYNPAMVASGRGGAIVAWAQGDFAQDIFAQRVGSLGELLWPPEGVAISEAAGSQFSPVMSSDGEGGAIVVWMDQRASGTHLYAQRVDSTGAVLWTEDGVPVCAADPGEQADARILLCEGGDVIIAWTDYRSYGAPNTNVYVQDIDFDGSGHWFSFPDGAWVATSEYNESTPQIVSDGAGGAIIAWYQDVPGATGARAMRINDGAQFLWGYGGVPLCNALIDPEGLRIASDGEGGIFAAWVDYRNGGTDVYVQRADAEGNVLWSSNGTNICSGPGEIQNVGMARDESGGMVVAWADYRFLNYECACAQRVSADGWWGNPEPSIFSCLDVPADQGGWVRLGLRASSHDVKLERDYPVEGYNVWRMIGSSGGPKSPAAPGGSSLDRAKLRGLMAECLKTPLVKLSSAQALALGFPEGEWESVGYHAATRDTAYHFLVPTRNDSTESGTAMETYLVTAHAPAGGVFVVSNPDSAWSVDNLAPGLTAGFEGNESASPPGLGLAWTPNAASDIGRYDVHRGADALFVPDESNLLESTTGTEVRDGTWMRAYRYFYKLVAVDRHGNKSPAALLTPDDIKVGTLLQGFAAALKLPGIEVSWTLSEIGAGVEFRLMRAAGANAPFEEVASPEIARDGLSFVCADRSVEPGTSYRYRVDVVGESGRRTLFETNEISTPEMPLTLHQNHPNPFNPSTTIGFYAPVSGAVTLDVYDSSGRLVTRLIDRAMKEKGTYSIEWRGVDAAGRSVSSGVYFYRLTCGKEAISKKMVLLR